MLVEGKVDELGAIPEDRSNSRATLEYAHPLSLMFTRFTNAM